MADITIHDLIEAAYFGSFKYFIFKDESIWYSVTYRLKVTYSKWLTLNMQKSKNKSGMQVKALPL